MHKDQLIGVALLLVSVIVIIAYAWLVFFPPLAGVDLLVLKLTGTVAIVAVFAILAWIGYTLATTPPPKPIEGLEGVEGELKGAEERGPTSSGGESGQKSEERK
jgi:predicted DNA-binding transcriptional regulator